MFGFDKSQEYYDQAYNQDQHHEGSLGHEVVAGGASFAAMKIFEDRQRAEGKTVNHAFAKELLAGIVGGEVDKLCETKGADWIDREKAKHQARQNAEQMYDQQYGQYDQYDPRQQEPHPHFRESRGERREERREFREEERREGGW